MLAKGVGQAEQENVERIYGYGMVPTIWLKSIVNKQTSRCKVCGIGMVWYLLGNTSRKQTNNPYL